MIGKEGELAAIEAADTPPPRSGMGRVMIVFGIAMLMLGIGQYQQTEEEAGWSTTEGRITKSQVTLDTLPSIRSGIRLAYHLHVNYAFNVEGVTYQGTRIRSRGSRISDLQSDTVKYPIGHAVTVHYDEFDRERSVLEPPSVVLAQIFMVLGVLVILKGSHFHFLHVRRRRRAKQPDDYSQIPGAEN